MGAIAKHVATMRGCSLSQIVAEIERMEDWGGKSPRQNSEIDEKLTIEFNQSFWPVYPHKVGKPVALRAYLKARRKHTANAIWLGLNSYIARKPADRPWLNPSTFLNQERYNDVEAIVSPSLKGVAAQRATLRQEIADGYERDGQANSNSGHDRRLAIGGPEHDQRERRRLL